MKEVFNLVLSSHIRWLWQERAVFGWPSLSAAGSWGPSLQELLTSGLNDGNLRREDVRPSFGPDAGRLIGSRGSGGSCERAGVGAGTLAELAAERGQEARVPRTWGDSSREGGLNPLWMLQRRGCTDRWSGSGCDGCLILVALVVWF